MFDIVNKTAWFQLLFWWVYSKSLYGFQEKSLLYYFELYEVVLKDVTVIAVSVKVFILWTEVQNLGLQIVNFLYPMFGFSPFQYLIFDIHVQFSILVPISETVWGWHMARRVRPKKAGSCKDQRRSHKGFRDPFVQFFHHHEFIFFWFFLLLL